MKRTFMSIALLVAVVACSDPAPSAEPPHLTEEFGCGVGFYVGDANQNNGLFVVYEDMSGAMAGDVATTSDLTSGDWTARLDRGTDVFANWCDDVLEPGEPTPVVDETWEVSGSIEVLTLPEGGQCGPATARLTDLVAQDDEGERLALGDLDVTNESWGCFAG